MKEYKAIEVSVSGFDKRIGTLISDGWQIESTHATTDADDQTYPAVVLSRKVKKDKDTVVVHRAYIEAAQKLAAACRMKKDMTLTMDQVAEGVEARYPLTANWLREKQDAEREALAEWEDLRGNERDD